MTKHRYDASVGAIKSRLGVDTRNVKAAVTKAIKTSMSTREREYSSAIAAAATLLELISEEMHRHPPDDHVSTETWELLEEWLDNPIVKRAVKAAE